MKFIVERCVGMVKSIKVCQKSQVKMSSQKSQIKNAKSQKSS